MAGENFNYPPGITSVEEWAARIAIRPGDIVAIQQDAILAERRCNTLAELAARNADYKARYKVT